MNTVHLTGRTHPVSPSTQAFVKLRSEENEAKSSSFAQQLSAHITSSRDPAYGVASQSSVTSQNSVAGANSSSPDALAAQLLASNQPPAAQSLGPLTAPLYSPDYMRQFTYNGFVSQANLQNQKTAAEYQLDMSNWALNEDQREVLGLPSQPPPTAPQYVAVNGPGYDQWWSSLSAGGDPAPVTFITPTAQQPVLTSNTATA